MTEYSVHLISRLDPLRYLFDRPALVGRLMRWLVLLTEFDIHYVTQKSIRGSIVADHLASLPVSDGRAIDDDFPDEDVAVVTSLSGSTSCTNNIVKYEVCILGLETALELGIRQMEVFVDSNLSQMMFTLVHDIYHFLRLDAYPEAATAKDKRALRQLAARFVICGETLYRRSPDGMLLLCLDRTSADRVMRKVHAGVCGPHMGGHMLACKIMRTGYFWLTMEIDCCQFVQRCPECQIHGNLIHVPPLELHALTSPWSFSVWVSTSSRRFRRNLPMVMSSSWLPSTTSPSGWRPLRMRD
ncbi:hypothetical protein CK203_034254 [Vitis vinifera]|uniref:Integrase zinc-binding domain-containing protein n=1 Tax=Vitis vinifera TaxID=29760 RepID=A0A438INR7_VITVI|nr:hypothetical protein CK203_034254 [Vitis vinifera]